MSSIGGLFGVICESNLLSDSEETIRTPGKNVLCYQRTTAHSFIAYDIKKKSLVGTRLFLVSFVKLSWVDLGSKLSKGSSTFL